MLLQQAAMMQGGIWTITPAVCGGCCTTPGTFCRVAPARQLSRLGRVQHTGLQVSSSTSQEQQQP